MVPGLRLQLTYRHELPVPLHRSRTSYSSTVKDQQAPSRYSSALTAPVPVLHLCTLVTSYISRVLQLKHIIYQLRKDVQHSYSSSERAKEIQMQKRKLWYTSSCFHFLNISSMISILLVCVRVRHSFHNPSLACALFLLRFLEWVSQLLLPYCKQILSGLSLSPK